MHQVNLYQQLELLQKQHERTCLQLEAEHSRLTQERRAIAKIQRDSAASTQLLQQLFK
jgi:hypothetical protein